MHRGKSLPLSPECAETKRRGIKKGVGFIKTKLRSVNKSLLPDRRWYHVCSRVLVAKEKNLPGILNYFVKF